MPGQFGTFIPIWNWHPALVGLFVFCIDFGAIVVIRILIERRAYLSRWWSFKIGDTIGLPVFAGFAAVVISDEEFSGFYTQTWWHAAVFVVGYLVSLFFQFKNLTTGFFVWEDVIRPSELYHTAIFGVMFYLIGTAVFAVGADHRPIWPTVIAFVGLGVHFVAWAVDNTPLVGKTPGRVLEAKEASLVDAH